MATEDALNEELDRLRLEANTGHPANTRRMDEIVNELNEISGMRGRFRIADDEDSELDEETMGEVEALLADLGTAVLAEIDYDGDPELGPESPHFVVELASARAVVWAAMSMVQTADEFEQRGDGVGEILASRMARLLIDDLLARLAPLTGEEF